MNRLTQLSAATVVALTVAGAVPALASPDRAAVGKPLKGTFSYTDATPDPTPTVTDVASKRSGFCVGNVPAAPADVNSHALKVSGRGTLTVTGQTTADWAMEVRTSKGVLLGGSDGQFPQDQEGALVVLPKAGTYNVIYCNLTGAPTATASYTFKPARAR